MSEGNVTRYALRRDEPLRVELDAFLDHLEGGEEIVSLDQGLEIVRVAEAVLESTRVGQVLEPATLA